LGGVDFILAQKFQEVKKRQSRLTLKNSVPVHLFHFKLRQNISDGRKAFQVVKKRQGPQWRFRTPREIHSGALLHDNCRRAFGRSI
jgi:hypothetical protein